VPVPDRAAAPPRAPVPREHAPRVAAVVPARDEAAHIEAVLRTMPPDVHAVVVVDDGSTDATAALARGVDDRRVEVLRHPRPRGVGAALRTGYRHAFAQGADIAVVMAGDGQMDPADLPSLLAPLHAGRALYAKGNRLAHPEARRAMPFVRWLGTHALSHLTRWTTGLDVADSQCGYTALHRRAADRIDLDALFPSYGYPNDLLSRLAEASVPVEDVVVRPVYGEERSGLRPRHLLVAFPRVLLGAALRRVRGTLGARSVPRSA
jgi:glycosyltransferase involved in cell wall biosynthesis